MNPEYSSPPQVAATVNRSVSLYFGSCTGVFISIENEIHPHWFQSGIQVDCFLLRSDEVRKLRYYGSSLQESAAQPTLVVKFQTINGANVLVSERGRDGFSIFVKALSVLLNQGSFITLLVQRLSVTDFAE